MIYNTFEEFAKYYLNMEGHENKTYEEVNKAYKIYKENLKRHLGISDNSKTNTGASK